MIDIFLICPVRNANEVQKKRMADYISALESAGKKVYYPARDTDQTDPRGTAICKANCEAIKQAKEIHIFYDPKSTGSVFDLGMAFALNKPLEIVNIDEIKETPHKSFDNVVIDWSMKE